MSAAPPSRLQRLGDTFGLEDGRFGWRWILGLSAAALVIAAAVHRLWDQTFSHPLRYSGDALLHAAYTLRLQEAGWYLDNDRLGAPFGLDAADFPLGGENLHWLALKVIGVVAPTPWAAINAYYLATYPLVAVAAFVVLRAFRVRPVPAAAAALLFAFLPFHQSRGVVHLLRSGYYIVPLLVLVVLWLAQSGRYLAPALGRASLFGFRRDRVLLIAAIGVAAGASDTQHAAYGVVLGVLLAAARAFAAGSARPLLLGLGFAVVVGASLVANNAPYVHKVVTEGANDAMLQRVLLEQDLYGLRAAHLILPVDRHRIGAVADFKADIVRRAPAGETASQPLGAVVALAFVATVAAAATFLVGRRDQRPEPDSRLQLVAVNGLVILLAIAVAAPGGLAFLLSAAGLTLYRTWNRMSVIVAFASLLGATALLELAWARLAASRAAFLARRPFVVVLGTVAVVLGILDQTPPAHVLAQPDHVEAAYAADAEFYAAVEAHHGGDGAIFQLPVTEFPEGAAVDGVDAATQLRAYLHTEDLRWTVGSIRGRPESAWLAQLDDLTHRDLLRALAVVGFEGVVVHEDAYEDGDGELGRALAALTGPPTTESQDRGLVHHDLRPLRDALEETASPEAMAAARARLLEPIVVSAPEALGAVESDGTTTWRWSDTSELVYELENPSEERRDAVLTAWFGHADPLVRRVRIEGPGIDRTVGTDAGPMTRAVTLPPGTSELRVTAGRGPVVLDTDVRLLGLLERHLSVHDEQVLDLLCDEPDPDERPYCPAEPAAPGGR